MHEKVFLITDGCIWEINKQTGNEHPHAIEVVDVETGAIRYIKSGSHITLVKGEVTDVRNQAAYNKSPSLPCNGQGVFQRREGKKKGGKKK